MIFHQLFEPLSSTYTYLIACENSRLALLIDPVYPSWERDLKLVEQLGLELAYTLETHVHADHITAARKLSEETGSKVVFPETSAVDCPDMVVRDNEPFTLGDVSLLPMYTPGHTDDHFCYLYEDRLMTGDALLIDGCGRTDFQNGDATQLFNSIHTRVFSLPDDTLIYPGHDYNGRRVSNIAQEKARNPRLGANRSLEEFGAIMSNLDLAYPKFIDYAVPGNRQCGVCPSHLPEVLEMYCQQMTQSPQG